MHPTTDPQVLRARLAATKSFQDVGIILLYEAMKFLDGAEIVCGPISTGGFGNLKQNLAAFEGTILDLQAQGRPILNQMPYEDKIFELKSAWLEVNPTSDYCWPTLWKIYFPTFAARLIKVAHFLPGSESSVGARWEKKWLAHFGAQINELPQSYASKFV